MEIETKGFTSNNNNNNNNEDNNHANEDKKNEVIEIKESKKVIVYGFDKLGDRKKVEKILKKDNISFEKVKKFSGKTFAIITFTDEEMKEKNVPLLKNIQIDGKSLEVKEYVNKTNLKKKRDEEENQGQNNPKKRKLSRDEEEPRSIEDVVTPLWKVPYEEQLKIKVKKTKEALESIVFKMKKEFKLNLPLWLKENLDKIKEEPLCPLLPIIPSPVERGYRNKVSFTIGNDEKGFPCIGFALGRSENNEYRIGDPSNCYNVSDHCKSIRNALQDFITSSPFKPYEKATHSGFWRQLTVRTLTTREAMVAIQYSPKGLAEELVNKEEERLVEFIKSKPELGITSFILQKWEGVSNMASPDCPYKVVLGEKYVHEKLFNLKFRISLNSFFQVNTLAAEKLYAVVAEWCPKNPDTLILDLCCGTGTIGLSLTKHVQVKKIIGVEMVTEAVEDARVNAKENQISNVEFIDQKAEVAMFVISKDLGPLQKCVAIVDPPRAGLHKDTIKAIRNSPTISSLIYVSCDRSGLTENSIDLCRPTSSKYAGIPFKPIKAVCVDLFPHTELVEVVVLFERDINSKSNSTNQQ